LIQLKVILKVLTAESVRNIADVSGSKWNCMYLRWTKWQSAQAVRL